MLRENFSVTKTDYKLAIESKNYIQAELLTDIWQKK